MVVLGEFLQCRFEWRSGGGGLGGGREACEKITPAPRPARDLRLPFPPFHNSIVESRLRLSCLGVCIPNCS